MRITNSDLAVHRGNLEERVQNSKRGWQDRAGAILVLEDELGNRGLGEASPLPGYSPDTFDECVQALQGVQSILPGYVFDDSQGLTRLLKQTTEQWPANITHPPAARFALETALLDLLGQRVGAPISRLLNPHVCQKRIAVNAIIPLDKGAPEAVRRVGAAMSRGIEAIKIKVGNAQLGFSTELAMLQEIRKQFGPQLEIRLDVNGAWTPTEAVEYLNRLGEIAPSFVEEPVEASQLADFYAGAVPLAADESLVDATLAEDLVRGRYCDVFVLKPAILGGFLRSLKLAEEALARGKTVTVTHMFDGPVAFAACRELALGLPAQPRACGLDLHLGLDAWPPVAEPLGVNGGFIYGSARPGLGLRADKFLEAIK